MLNKKVIYTVITGGYDNLIEQPSVKGYDFVCFTDNPNLKSITWQIRPLPEGLEGLTSVKQQRNIKILAHKYLPEYDFSIYIDGNVQIIGDVNKFVKENCAKSKGYIFIGKHPDRDCIYEEAKACIYAKKDDSHLMADQVIAYHKEGMPLHYGLTQNCIILRYHNNENCKRLMELWWNEVKEKSHRDQLSLYYCLWKDRQNGNDTNITVLDKSIFHGDTFNWGVRHQQKKPSILAKTNDSVYYMRFLKPGQTPWSWSQYTDFFKDKKVIDIGWLNVKFLDGWFGNEHHLYPDNFYKMILPLMSLYIKNFNFNISDFEYVPYFTKNGNFDLSYLIPKNKDLRFTIEKNNKVLAEHEDFSCLHGMDGKGTFDSDYHRLFRGYHSCCKIVNETIDNEKKLFISGDSMMIPAIPILACYYKEVVYMDNRSENSYKKYYENVIFDDVIFQMLEGKNIKKYLIDNLK